MVRTRYLACSLLLGATACGDATTRSADSPSVDATSGANDARTTHVIATTVDTPQPTLVDSPASAVPSSEIKPTSTTTQPVDTVISERAAAAVADLAAREGIDADDIAVVADEAVTWPDGSLGCPEPGMMYTLALTPGYRVLLVARGRQFAYHGAPGRAPFFCATPRKPAAGTEGP